MLNGSDSIDTEGQCVRNAKMVGMSAFLVCLAIYGLHLLYITPSARVICLLSEGFLVIPLFLKIFGWFFGVVMIVMAMTSFTSPSTTSGDFCDGGIEGGDYYDSYDYY